MSIVRLRYPSLAIALGLTIIALGLPSHCLDLILAITMALIDTYYRSPTPMGSALLCHTTTVNLKEPSSL